MRKKKEGMGKRERKHEKVRMKEGGRKKGKEGYRKESGEGERK